MMPHFWCVRSTFVINTGSSVHVHHHVAHLYGVDSGASFASLSQCRRYTGRPRNHDPVDIAMDIRGDVSGEIVGGLLCAFHRLHEWRVFKAGILGMGARQLAREISPTTHHHACVTFAPSRHRRLVPRSGLRSALVLRPSLNVSAAEWERMWMVTMQSGVFPQCIIHENIQESMLKAVKVATRVHSMEEMQLATPSVLSTDNTVYPCVLVDVGGNYIRDLCLAMSLRICIAMGSLTA